MRAGLRAGLRILQGCDCGLQQMLQGSQSSTQDRLLKAEQAAGLVKAEVSLHGPLLACPLTQSRSTWWWQLASPQAGSSLCTGSLSLQVPAPAPTPPLQQTA